MVAVFCFDCSEPFAAQTASYFVIIKAIALNSLTPYSSNLAKLFLVAVPSRPRLKSTVHLTSSLCLVVHQAHSFTLYAVFSVLSVGWVNAVLFISTQLLVGASLVHTIEHHVQFQSVPSSQPQPVTPQSTFQDSHPQDNLHRFPSIQVASNPSSLLIISVRCVICV